MNAADSPGSAPLWWMGGVSVLSWLVLFVTTGARLHPEGLYGMLGPLVAVAGTWVVTERTFRSDPAKVMAVMVGGLVVKAVFFGVYVAVMLRGLDLRPRPFMFSFTAYFIALYGMEALFLKRLFK
jgi:hypothetical protein